MHPLFGSPLSVVAHHCDGHGILRRIHELACSPAPPAPTARCCCSFGWLLLPTCPCPEEVHLAERWACASVLHGSRVVRRVPFFFALFSLLLFIFFLHLFSLFLPFFFSPFFYHAPQMYHGSTRAVPEHPPQARPSSSKPQHHRFYEKKTSRYESLHRKPMKVRGCPHEATRHFNTNRLETGAGGGTRRSNSRRTKSTGVQSNPSQSSLRMTSTS